MTYRAQTLNIPAAEQSLLQSNLATAAWLEGHSHALHKAAEIAARADAEITSLRTALREQTREAVQAAERGQGGG